ncbi:hypothetical protein OH76DRAFT_1322336, partial [Lentinus brumalis]
PSMAKTIRKKAKILLLTPEEASGQEVELSALRRNSDVYIEELWLTDDQREKLEAIYAFSGHPELCNRQFSVRKPKEQVEVAALLASEGLDPDGRASIGNRWTSRWWMDSEKKGIVTRRELYQCDCGYDHTVRESRTRRVAVAFTGCLAHAEILSEVATGRILMVRGLFTHNDGCKSAFLTRIPHLRLHPEVFSVALKQLSVGAQLADIQATNLALFESRGYAAQPADLSKSPYRWLLQKTDTTSLYRQFNRIRGVRTKIAPQDNIHAWLDPHSPSYKEDIASAVFHYAARTERGERFEVCLATKEMRAAAWKYGHGSQIILDGTFGVCDRRVLLFIAMAVDEQGSGVPLAFFLFSAASGAQNTSASYNTDLLERLLLRWKHSLASSSPEPGAVFAPKVAITDTDLKERGALVKGFPHIWLLLCKFHLRQSWRNHRTRVLKGTSTLHSEVRLRLRKLEETLVDSQEYSEAMAVIQNERAVIAAEVQPKDSELASSAVVHLDYLTNYWMQEALWKSWSGYGRRVAGERLGSEVVMILTTTNHLESFNGVLKRKHLRRWQRGNRRLRIDVLLHLLITSIIPSIFAARALEEREHTRLMGMLKTVPGGAQLVEQCERSRTARRSDKSSPLTAAPYAFLAPDLSRDTQAAELLSAHQISVPTYVEHLRAFEFECFSSLATPTDAHPLQYTIVVGLDGSAACSCPDFRYHGGACKHLRAAILRLGTLRRQGLGFPDISLPATLEDARA